MGADGFQPPGAAQTLPMPAVGLAYGFRPGQIYRGYAAHALGSLK
jgi:hypothetical protein